MSTGEAASADMIDWHLGPDHPHAKSPRASSRARRNEGRVNSLALIVTTSLLFVLVISALLVGHNAVFGPFLNRETSAADRNSIGDIVYTMPDGVFCRHMSFDNVTGAVRESGMERCAELSEGPEPGGSTTFKWNAR
jgi:hypothetical protein